MKTEFIATRNGLPCQLMTLDVPHLPRIRNILVPSPIPPTPHVFRRGSWAMAAIRRTKTASQRLRESIHADFIRASFPALSSLFTEAKYECHSNAVAKKQEVK